MRSRRGILFMARHAAQCRIAPACLEEGPWIFRSPCSSSPGRWHCLLWGVHMVQSGVQRVFGARLRGLLSRALRNRFKAFLAGLGVTAILQSSTATGLMVTGLRLAGLWTLCRLLAVMLGANVGAALIGWLLSPRCRRGSAGADSHRGPNVSAVLRQPRVTSGACS